MKTDKDLILKITESLGFFEQTSDIAQILYSYSNDSNPDRVFHELSDHIEKKLLNNINISDEGVESEEDYTSVSYQYWLEIQDSLFQVKYLRGFEMSSMYNDSYNRWIFTIIVNPHRDDLKTVPIYGNTVIQFVSKKDRDLYWSKLKRKLSNFAFIRFI